MRMGMTMYEKKTAGDYVQAGLVAMWDGIENAGWGIHNNPISDWKDLIGNNTGFNNVVAYQNYVKCADSASWVDKRLGDSIDSAFSSNTFTIELAFKCETTENQFAWYGRTQNGGSAWIDSIAFLISTLNPDYYRWGYYGRYSGNAVYKGDGVVQTSLVKNSSNPKIFDRGNDTGMSIADNDIHIYGNRSLFFSTTRYYSIRIYNRGLSPDEVASNYMIDSLRFNLH